MKSSLVVVELVVAEPVVVELVETTTGLFLTADTSTGSVSASAALVGSVVLEPVETMAYTLCKILMHSLRQAQGARTCWQVKSADG